MQLNNKGFVWLPVLLAILGVLAVSGGAYYYVQYQHYEQSQQGLVDGVLPADTTSQTTTQAAQVGGKPSIWVLSANPNGPATITVSYTNLPTSTSALAVCQENGACSEWVENFRPPTPSGTYTMSVTNAFGSQSQKGLGEKTFKIVVIGSSFSDQITTSPLFTVPDTQNVSVPGMSQYTDTNFGFSFWYPNTWTVNSPAGDEPGIGANLEDCTFKKSFSVHGNQLSNGVSIGEYYCPNLSMTLRGADGANPVGMDIKYYFDTTTHTWMISDLSDPPNGSPRTTRPADVSNNTMGGLHIFAGVARFGANVVIPLSARNFLIVSTNDGGGYIDERLFAKTIVAADPSVATPVNAAEQIKFIQAEKDAYASSENITLDYFRIASSDQTSARLEWSVQYANPDSCTMLQFTDATKSFSSHVQSFPVSSNGSLTVAKGYFYDLGCSGSHDGQNATVSADINLLNQ